MMTLDSPYDAHREVVVGLLFVLMLSLTSCGANPTSTPTPNPQATITADRLDALRDELVEVRQSLLIDMSELDTLLTETFKVQQQLFSWNLIYVSSSSRCSECRAKGLSRDPYYCDGCEQSRLARSAIMRRQEQLKEMHTQNEGLTIQRQRLRDRQLEIEKEISSFDPVD